MWSSRASKVVCVREISIDGFARHPSKTKGLSTNTRKTMVDGYEIETRLASWGIRMVDKAWTQEEKLVWALVFSLQKWKSYLLG